MSTAKIREICASLFGVYRRELPGFGRELRQAIEETLAEFGAVKYGEAGTPAYETNNEYFRIGGRKLKVSTDHEMFVSLWGSKAVVEPVYAKIMERLATR
jgi:hypothetical protein